MVLINPEYQSALNYIYSFIDYSLKRHLDKKEADFKLDRMRQFMQHLDNPQDKYKIIHVAGTKGKGSVSALCASALISQGYKVGLYTSPHLQDFSERIQVNCNPIDPPDIVRLVGELKKVVELIPDITTFELTTALGFLYFAEQQVDIAVVEVGLGGRLDATNVVNPLVSVITSISFDHTAVLGNTLKEIAYEKGGIIKPKRPVVVSPQKDEALNEIRRISIERSSLLIDVGADYHYHYKYHTLDEQSFKVWKKSKSLDESKVQLEAIEKASRAKHFVIPLLGAHQVVNAVTAYAALQVAKHEGLRITEKAIKVGFKNVNWPARFELLRKEPPVIVDGAHNVDSMEKLKQALDEYFPAFPFILILGMSADKDIDGMLSVILPRVRKVITTRSIHPRAMNPYELLRKVKVYHSKAEAIYLIEAAIQKAVKEAKNEMGIVITGSVFVAAAGRAVWREIKK